MEPPQSPARAQIRRLDSWKDIAEYLGRDVRTATRWESQGLPVHRVPGGKGRSVFALSDEVDRWLAGHPQVDTQSSPAAAEESRAPRRAMPIVLACAIGAIALAGVVGVLGRRPSSDGAPLQLTATAAAISVGSGAAPPRVIHQFEPGAVLVSRDPARMVDRGRDQPPEIVVAVSFYENPADRSVRPGELLALSSSGRMRWRFAFDEVLTFGGVRSSGPWALADWQGAPAGATHRIAVAAHDFTWWPSLVAVVDGDGRRLSTFVNPGWMESLLWLDGERLAIGGFNDARNAAMLAVVDTSAGGRAAPGTAGSSFACEHCPQAAPRFYATLPRSELNLLTGAPFNRAQVALIGDHLRVTTSEVPNSTIAAIYDFDRDLRLVRAGYSASYWDLHRRLELEGKLRHGRAECPERDGPSAASVWHARDGWVRVRPSAH